MCPTGDYGIMHSATNPNHYVQIPPPPYVSSEELTKLLQFYRDHQSKIETPVLLTSIANDAITYVGLIIDRSGSMHNVKNEALAGFNENLQNLQLAHNKGQITLVTTTIFNNDITIRDENTVAPNVRPLTEDEYIPKGYTALRDALGFTIEKISNRMDLDLNKGKAALIITISDGLENASSVFSKEKLKELITSKQNSGNWTFTYLLANQDIVEAMTAFDIPMDNVVSYKSTEVGTREAFSVSADSVNSFYAARKEGALNSTRMFSNSQRDKLNKLN